MILKVIGPYGLMVNGIYCAFSDFLEAELSIVLMNGAWKLMKCIIPLAPNQRHVIIINEE